MKAKPIHHQFVTGQNALFDFSVLQTMWKSCKLESTDYVLQTIISPSLSLSFRESRLQCYYYSIKDTQFTGIIWWSLRELHYLSTLSYFFPPIPQGDPPLSERQALNLSSTSPTL